MKRVSYTATIMITGITLTSTALSSCMHVGIPMMHSDMTNQSEDEPVLQKEVIAGNLRAVATFPPIETGKAVVITLKLSDASTGKQISGAQVWFHDEYLHKTEPKMPHYDMMMQNEVDTGHGGTEHDINFQSMVKEASTPGEYSFVYTTSQPGLHKLMFHVTSRISSDSPEEVVVEAERMIRAYMKSHHGISGWMGETTTYVIIGSAIMGAMMILVLLTGRHI